MEKRGKGVSRVEMADHVPSSVTPSPHDIPAADLRCGFLQVG